MFDLSGDTEDLIVGLLENMVVNEAADFSGETKKGWLHSGVSQVLGEYKTRTSCVPWFRYPCVAYDGRSNKSTLLVGAQKD